MTSQTVHPNRQIWDVFLCYRQSDGRDVAEALYGALQNALIDILLPDSPVPPRVRVYFDQTAPAIDNWESAHRPALERARTMIFVSSPGASVRLGRDDWVHAELRWWIKRRRIAPIIVETTSDSRYIPKLLLRYWPKTQRIPILTSETHDLDLDSRTQLSDRVRLRITDGIKLQWERRQPDALEARRRIWRRRLMIASYSAAAAVLLAVAISGAVTFRRDWQRDYYLTPPKWKGFTEVPLSDSFDSKVSTLATASVFGISESVEDIDYKLRAVNIWDLRTGSLMETIDPPDGATMHSAAMSIDGHLVAMGGEGGIVVVYQASPWREIARLSPPNPAIRRCIVQKLEFNDLGDRLAWGDSCNWIHVWKLGTSTEMVESAALPANSEKNSIRPGVRQIAFDRTGTRLVVLSLNIWPRTVYIYEIATKSFTASDVTSKEQSIVGLISIAATNEGRLLAFFHDQDEGVLVYDIERKERLARLPTLPFSGVYFATLSRDGSFAAGATTHESVCFWQKRKDEFIITGEIQDNAKALSVSPDGRTVAAHAGQGTVVYRYGVRIWGHFFGW